MFFNFNTEEIRKSINEEPNVVLKHIENFPNNNYSLNKVIIGDSLDALKLLKNKYFSSIKAIYIDPPYNTGNSFVYNDRFKKVGSTISNNHISWINFIYPRLYLSKYLLREDGLIFVSIDDNEYHYLRLMMDDIFGEDNYVNTFCWINNLKGRQIRGFGAAKTYEYVVVYSKNVNNISKFYVDYKKFKDIMPGIYKNFNYKIKKDEYGPFVIKNQLYNSNSMFNESTRPNLVFNIHYNFETKEIRFSDVDENIEYEGFVKIPPITNNDGIHRFRDWRWSKEKILREKHNLFFLKYRDKVRVYTKVRNPDFTVLKDVIFIPSYKGGRELKEIFSKRVYDYPKPIELIKILLGFTIDNDIILDFFAGSGTTGHAVMELNKEDGKNRSFILVQLDEPIKNKRISKYFLDISEICIQRLKKICTEYGSSFEVLRLENNAL